jgi:hypothetical protein
VNDAEVIAAFKRQQKELETERKKREELQKQINANANAQKEADRAALESAKIVRAEQDKLAASAAKIAEAVQTPLQRYKKGLSELVDHLRAGRLTSDQYRAASDNLKKAYQDQAGITDKVAAAERLKNEEMREAKRIIDQMMTPQQRYEKSVAKLTDLHQKGRLSLDQYNTAVKAEKDALDKTSQSGDKVAGSLDGLGTRISSAAAGFASMGTVITFLKTEYDGLLQRQGKSADANISLAAEQEALLMNLGDADAGAVTGQIRELSKQSGIKEQYLTAAVNESMAARADLSVEDVMAGVSAAAQVRKFAPTELAGLGSAAIDTRKQTGLGTEESLGFLMQLQAQSRTKNLKGLAENFTPAVGAVMNFGADRQTAGGILAALSHGMGDTTGAQTRTSAIQFAKQLRSFSGGKPVDQAIADLQANPEQRAAFLKASSFEAAALPAIESLLSGGTQAGQYRTARTALQANPRAAFESAISARDLPAMNLAAQDQALGNMADQQRLNDTAGAASSIARTRLQEIRAQAGRNGMISGTQSMVEDLISGGNQTPEGTIAAIEAEISALEGGQTDRNRVRQGVLNSVMPGAGLLAGQADVDTAAKDPATQETVALLRDLLAETKKQVAASEQKVHAGVVAARARQNEGGM